MEIFVVGKKYQAQATPGSISRGAIQRPLLLYSALMGQWRYSLWTDKLTATIQIAERVYSLAQEQNNAALLISAYRASAIPLYYFGDFETARQYAMRGAQMWHSGSVPSPVEEPITPAVGCLCFEALSEWHLGEIASCQTTMAEAIALDDFLARAVFSSTYT